MELLIGRISFFEMLALGALAAFVPALIVRLVDPARDFYRWYAFGFILFPIAFVAAIVVALKSTKSADKGSRGDPR